MVSPAFGSITLAAGGTYSSKPRPVLIFQNDAFPTGESTVIIPFTSKDAPGAHYRVAVASSRTNGLDRKCWLEVDKVGAIRSAWLGPVLGSLEPDALQTAIALARQLMSPAPDSTS